MAFRWVATKRSEQDNRLIQYGSADGVFFHPVLGDGSLDTGRSFQAAWLALHRFEIAETPLPQTVHMVEVEGRDDGVYLFATADLAHLFAEAVVESGSDLRLTEETICGARETVVLCFGEQDDRNEGSDAAGTVGS